MSYKKGPWTIIESKSIYKNSWITITEDKVIRPDGKEGIFGVVEMIPGVSILPIDSEGYVYLVKEYRYAVGCETIETIGGGIDKGEDKKSSAERELKEESGIIAGELIDFGMVDSFTSVIDSPNYLFLARNLEFTDTSFEGTEKIEIIKVPLKEAIQWVIESKITHGASATLILKAKDFLSI